MSNETIPNDHLIWESLLALNNNLVQQPTLDAQADLISHFLSTPFGGKLWLTLFDLPETLVLESSVPSDIEQKLLNKIKIEHQLIYEFDTQLQLHCLGLPLIQQEKLIGVMVISRQRQPFNQEVTRQLEALSHIAATSFNAIIQSQLQRFRQKQLDLVRTVSAQLVNITDLDILTQEISRLLLKTFDYYYVAIFTHEPQSEELIFRASARSPETSQPQFEYLPGAKLKIGEHIVGHVAQSGESLLANDVTKEPRYGHVDSLSETRSEVALPLMINRKVIGVLDVQSDQFCAFDENDLLLLNALADNIAIAIHRVRLYNVARIHAEQMATIAEVSQAITYIFDLDELLIKVVSLIHERYAFPYVHVFITQPAQNRVVFKAGSGSRSTAFKEAEISYDLDSEKGIIPWVAKHGKVKCINNVKTNPQFISNPVSQGFTGSELALPLVFGKEVVGVLDIQSDKVNAFTEQDQELMKTLSANIAIAVRNAKLYRSELWRRQVAESLRDVAVLLTNNASIDNVLNMILDELQKILPCDIAAIWLYDDQDHASGQLTGQNLHLAAVNTNESIDDELLSTLSWSSTAWFNRALDPDTPLIRKSTDSSDPIAAALDLPENYSAIAAPLQTAGQQLGLLTLIHHTPGRYGYESQNITASFASYAAISVENARLFESSQEQAWISTVLLQVAQATQSLSTIPELVSTVVRLPPLLVGVEGCALFLRESETDLFMLHAMYGITHEEEDLKEPLSVSTAPIFSDLILTQSPMVVHDPKLEINLPDDIASGLEDKTLVILPLITHNELLGAFLLVHDASFSGGKFTDLLSDERLAIIQGITQQTAIAVENIRLLEAKQEEAYVSTVLLQVAQAVVSNATLEDVLESIVHIMPILVGIDYSIIYLWDSETEKFFTKHVHYASAKADEEKELLENTYTIGEFPLLDAVKASNKVILHPFETILPPEDWDLAIPDETIEDIAPILNSHYGLLMGFPLAVNNEVFGVLIT
ncbi:MAG: GAF domain-containing protein, partial [Chloroflexota bacterium]